jgi:hypothetical protein
MPYKYNRLKPCSTYVFKKFLLHLHLASKELFLVGAKYQQANELFLLENYHHYETQNIFTCGH